MLWPHSHQIQILKILFSKFKRTGCNVLLSLTEFALIIAELCKLEKFMMLQVGSSLCLSTDEIWVGLCQAKFHVVVACIVFVVGTMACFCH